VPEHASIARRQLAIFVGRSERCIKNLIRIYVKDFFTETSNFGYSEILISCDVNDSAPRMYQKLYTIIQFYCRQIITEKFCL